MAKRKLKTAALGFLGTLAGISIALLLTWPETSEAGYATASCTWTCAGSTVDFDTLRGTGTLTVSTPHPSSANLPANCTNAAGDTVYMEEDNGDLIVTGTCVGTRGNQGESLACDGGSCVTGSMNCDSISGTNICWEWDDGDDDEGDINFARVLDYSPPV